MKESEIKQVNFKIGEERHQKLFDIAHKRKISMNQLVKNIIDELEKRKVEDIIITNLKIISNMLQGRIDGNFCTMSDEKILESVEDLIKYLEDDEDGE